MATLTSHTLNSVDGTHAGGIAVELIEIAEDGTRTNIFRDKMDEGGRLSKDIISPDDSAVYELVFKTGEYFEALAIPRAAPQTSKEVVIRFEMKDPDGDYHIPLMLSPNSYSVWWSS